VLIDPLDTALRSWERPQVICFGVFTQPRPLATIVADEADDSLWFEIYVEGKSVQIPLRIVQVALSAALEGVRSEAWYSLREDGGQEPAQSTSNDVAKE